MIPRDWVIRVWRDLLRLVRKFNVSCAQNLPLSPQLRTLLARRSPQHVVGQLPIFVLPSHAGPHFFLCYESNTGTLLCVPAYSKGLIRFVLWRVWNSRGRPFNAPAAFSI